MMVVRDALGQTLQGEAGVGDRAAMLLAILQSSGGCNRRTFGPAAGDVTGRGAEEVPGGVRRGRKAEGKTKLGRKHRSDNKDERLL